MDRLRYGATAAIDGATAAIGGATAATVKTKPPIKRDDKPQDLTTHIHTILKNPGNKYSGLPVCDQASVEYYSTQDNKAILDFSEAVFDQFSKDRSGATLGENSAILFPAKTGSIPEGWSGVRIVYKTDVGGQQGAYLLWKNNGSSTETNAYAFGKEIAYQHDGIIGLPRMKDTSLVRSDLIADAYYQMLQCPIDPHEIYGSRQLEAGAPRPNVAVAEVNTYETVNRSAALEGDVAASRTRLDVSTLGEITNFLSRADYKRHEAEIDKEILESEWSESGHSTGTLIREEQDSYTFLFITEVEEVDPEGDDGDTIITNQSQEIAITFSGDSFDTQGKRFKSLKDAALYLAQQNGLDLAVVKDEAIDGGSDSEDTYGTGRGAGKTSILWNKYDVPTDLEIEEFSPSEAAKQLAIDKHKASGIDTFTYAGLKGAEAAWQFATESSISMDAAVKMIQPNIKEREPNISTLIATIKASVHPTVKNLFLSKDVIADIYRGINHIKSTSNIDSEDALRIFLAQINSTLKSPAELVNGFEKMAKRAAKVKNVPAGGPLGGVTVARTAKGTGSRSSGSNESSDSQSRSRGLLGRLFSRSSQPAQVAVKDSAAEIDFDSQVYGAAVAPKMLEENIVPQGQTINYMKQLQAGQCFVGVGSDGSHYLYKQGQKITIGNNIEIAHIKAGMKVHGLTQLMQWTGNQLTPLK